MRLSLFFIICFLNGVKLYSQAYSWATTDNTYQNSVGGALAIDPAGNLFVAETYSNSGIRSGVNVIKYDISHNILWKQKIEGNYIEHCCLATDASGNINITGTFGDSLLVNTFVYTTPCKGCPHMFLIQFNSSGVFQWMNRSTGYAALGRKASTDSQNNIYVAGNVMGNNYFDSFNVVTPMGAPYNFIAKYNSLGSMLWVKVGVGTTGSTGLGLKTDALDNTYLAGCFTYTATFASLTVAEYGPWGFGDIYLAKINPAGQWLWVKHAGGDWQEGLSDLDLDVNGNPYITGFISSISNTIGTIVLANTGQDDYLLAKYDPNGNAIWAVNGGGPGSQFGAGVTIDAQGTVYMARTGTYFSKFDIGGNYLNSDFTSASNVDMVRNNSGCIYITGDIGSSVTFGSNNLSPTQAQQMYIAEFCNSTSSGVEENEISNTFSVYPNPTTNKLIISCGSNNHRNICTISIKNALGQIIYTESVKDASGAFAKQIDISTIPKGIYFIELQSSSNKNAVKKIILQ